jgi:hypothetical protein
VTFERPAFLWLLAALAPVAAGFLASRRRPRIEVPDLAAWRAAASAARRPAGFRRLTSLASLLLNLGAVACAALAAAGPRGQEPPSQDWAVVIDVSASMGAADSRWERALAGAGSFVRGMSRRDRWRLLLAGSPPRAVGGWRRGGDALPILPPPADVAGDVEGALALAPGARAVVWSDRPTRAEFAPRIADRSDDFAVEGLTFAREWAATAVEVEATISNRGTLPGVPVVEFICGGAATRVVLAALPPGESVRAAAVLDAPEGGILAARLGGSDALAVDDAAYAIVPPLRRARVVAVEPDEAKSPFLRSALAALEPSLEAGSGVAGAKGEEAAREAGADLFVYDRIAPIYELERGAALFFASRGAHAPAVSGAEAERPAITGWASDHPILRHLDLSRLRIARARPFARDPRLAVLIDSSAGPLAVAGEAGALKFAAFAFALEDSNLPLLAAFPLLIRSAVEVLAAPPAAPSIRVGDRVDPFGKPCSAWRDGVTWEQNGLWLADRPGVAVFTRDGVSRPVAVNWGRPEESTLVEAGQGREAPGPGAQPVPAWMWLASAGAGLLALDALAFGRR